MLLDLSSTRAFGKWVATHAKVLSDAIYPADDEEIAERERPLAEDATSQFERLRIDVRGADATVYTWAYRTFRARMLLAAKELHSQGFGTKNMPEHLGVDCFKYHPPNGFLM